MVWGSVLTSLIYMWLSSFPNTTCWRDCLFSIVYFCLLCHRLIDLRCVGLFWGFLFCSIELYVCFCVNNKLFWICSFVVLSVEGLCLQLCSFSPRIALAILGLLWFHINFRIICSSSVKKCHRYFDRDHVKSVDCFGKSGHFNNVDFPIHKHGISFYFFEAPSISLSCFYTLQHIDLSPPWLTFFLGILFYFFDAFFFFWLHWVFCCCVRDFSSCSEQGLLFVAVRGLLIVAASLVVEHRL